jgi:hypothetical protein
MAVSTCYVRKWLWLWRNFHNKFISHRQCLGCSTLRKFAENSPMTYQRICHVSGLHMWCANCMGGLLRDPSLARADVADKDKLNLPPMNALHSLNRRPDAYIYGLPYSVVVRSPHSL